MAARGFRSIGRQWTEVSADAPATESLTYIRDDEDDDVDELAPRRGRRPGRPHSARLGSAQEAQNGKPDE